MEGNSYDNLSGIIENVYRYCDYLVRTEIAFNKFSEWK